MERISRLNPILEVLKSSPGRVNKIFIEKGKGQPRLSEIIRLAKASQVPFILVPGRRLDSLERNHQGAVAFVSPKEFSSLEDILSTAQKPFLVLLDSIEDPQNLGAILRTAEGAGVDGVILPERRSAGLTETVMTVSAGALEHLRVARVKNLARTIDDLKSRGIWLVGAEGGAKEYWHEFDYNQPIAIVLGSEGKGLHSLIRKKCDKVLSIPLLGKITSLNVSAAAAIFLYEVVRQRGSR